MSIFNQIEENGTSLKDLSNSKLVICRPNEQSMIITSGNEIIAVLAPSFQVNIEYSKSELTIVYLHILDVPVIHMLNPISQPMLWNYIMNVLN